MHENTKGVLNEVSSVQISSMLLLHLMILSVTPLSLIGPSLYNLTTQDCVCMWQSLNVHETCMSDWIGALFLQKPHFGLQNAENRHFTVFPLRLIVVLYFDPCHCVKKCEAPRLQTEQLSRSCCLYGSLYLFKPATLRVFRNKILCNCKKWINIEHVNKLDVPACERFLVGVTGCRRRPVSRCWNKAS